MVVGLPSLAEDVAAAAAVVAGRAAAAEVSPSRRLPEEEAPKTPALVRVGCEVGRGHHHLPPLAGNLLVARNPSVEVELPIAVAAAGTAADLPTVTGAVVESPTVAAVVAPIAAAAAEAAEAP